MYLKLNLRIVAAVAEGKADAGMHGKHIIIIQDTLADENSENPWIVNREF